MRKITCDHCKLTFEPEWTQEESLAEKERLFPNVPMEDCVDVCDICFEAAMDFNEPGLKRYEK